MSSQALAVDTFHLWLTARLERLGMSQVELADAIGVTASTVSRWTHGSRTPIDAIIPDLARALRVPPEDVHAAMGRINLDDAGPTPLQADVLYELTMMPVFLQRMVLDVARILRRRWEESE